MLQPVHGQPTLCRESETGAIYRVADLRWNRDECEVRFQREALRTGSFERSAALLVIHLSKSLPPSLARALSNRICFRYLWVLRDAMRPRPVIELRRIAYDIDRDVGQMERDCLGCAPRELEKVEGWVAGQS